MPTMTFIDHDGKRHEVDAPVGLSVLEIAHRNKIDLEGACEGSLACSTCHVVVDPEDIDRLAEPSEDEEDINPIFHNLIFKYLLTSDLSSAVDVISPICL